MKTWLRDTCILGALALLWLVFPVAGQGAERRSVDESLNTQPQTSKPSESDVEKRLDQIDGDLETILGEQDKIKEQLKRNRLQWSGSLRATCNNFHTVDNSNTLIGVTTLGRPVYGPPVQPHLARDYGSAWVSRLRLTMSYDITDNLKFYGQLVAFKYFNLNVATQSQDVLDMVETRYPSDLTLRVERAYFDWWITSWLTLNIGRSSSPEGPPAELKENTERNTAWGVQMVEAATDGVSLTFNMSSLLEGTSLRLSYMPFATFVDARTNYDNGLFSNGGFKDMQAYAAMYEMKIPGLGDNVFQLGSTVVPQFRPRNNAIFVLDPWTSAPNTAIFPDTNSLPQDLGLYAQLNTLLEVKDFLGTGLDFFGAYALTILNPTYKTETYPIPVASNGLGVYYPGNPPTFALAWPSGVDLPYPVGLASYDDAKKGPHHGEFVFVGFRYSLPEQLWSFFKDYPFRVGFEFNRGTKYHVIFSAPSDLLINKLSVKGNVFEAYLIQQLVPNHLFMRLGYVYLQREYTGTYIGPTQRVNQLVHNAYLLVDASW